MQCINLCDWILHVRDLKLLNAFIKIAWQHIKMESYCLKCKKILETLIQKFLVLVTAEKWYYQSAQYVVVKSLDLLSAKKQKDY